jgi:hypothetical protein
MWVMQMKLIYYKKLITNFQKYLSLLSELIHKFEKSYWKKGSVIEKNSLLGTWILEQPVTLDKDLISLSLLIKWE